MNSGASNKVKLYIGCSLTHSPDEFKSSVEKLKSNLEEKYEVFHFLGIEKGSATDVYEWDINNCLTKCDLFVAICDHSSLGLGYEIGTAIESFKKPVLAVAQKETYISRLIIGVNSPLYSFKRYDKIEEITKLIEHKLSEVH